MVKNAPSNQLPLSGLEYHSSGKTKTEVFKWKVIDEPGEQMLISKNELQIDPVYQRVLQIARVTAIARSWSWTACGALSVALRDPGFFVFDGQHRLEAAKRCADIDKLPCIVFMSEGVQTEARGFLATNTQRTAISVHDRFHAKTVIDDPNALKMIELAAFAGRRIAHYGDPNTVHCLYHFERCLVQDEAALRRIWPIMIRLCEGRSFNASLLSALHWLEVNVVEGQTCADTISMRHLVEAGFDALILKIRQASAQQGRAGSSVYGYALLKIMNHRRRNPLTLKQD